MRYVVAALCACFTMGAQADINVNMTNSTVSIAAPDTLQLNNVNVPGYGNYSLQLKWSSSALGFVYVPNTLQVAAAASCGQQSYPLPGANDSIYATSRVVNGVEYGALTNITPESLYKSSATGAAGAFPYYYWDQFVVVWARTSTQAANPYLAGHTITNFDPTKGYGYVTGTNTNGDTQFNYGDIVEVVGSPQSGNTLAIKQVSGNVSLLLANGVSLAPPSSNTTCAASASGSYLATTQGTYTVSIKGDAAFIANAGGYNFQASWSVSSGAGVVAQSADTTHSTSNYTNFGGMVANDKLIVQDIGNGLSFTSVDANGKVLAGSAFFLKYYPY